LLSLSISCRFLLGQRRKERTGRKAARIALGVTFVAAGALHFLRPRMYMAIMPPYVPAHRELVYASGVAEIAGGLAALHPRREVQRFGGLWLAATLVAVFPANLHMALNPEDYKSIPPAALWSRLPVQGAIIAWALAATRPDD
jgi:uncharacterized membrane protein